MKLIDDDKELNWGLIILLVLNASYWVCVWKFGFFLPTMWTVVGACIVGLWLRLSGRA
tara:strand:- start:2269 stop:2442 length:174 start_codon:yes stop_codon:yes gene_type:complete